MSLFRPGARLTLDGRSLSGPEAALLRLRVELTVSGAHDLAQLQLWSGSKFADAAPGASLAIALGDTGSEEDVWAGELSGVRATPQGVVLEGVAATAALSRSYRSQSYLNQSVADIVRDLAGPVPVDNVQCDVKLAAYHVDNRRSAWSHLQNLAALVGADLGSAPGGGLRFVASAGANRPTRLRHGAELLHWDVARRAQPEAAAGAAHGSASESGEKRWHWLSHDPVGAGAGPTRVPAALATRDAAQAVANALQQRAARAAVSGELWVQGMAGLRPGDMVELADVQGADPGRLRILGMTHTLDSRSGFLTRLRVEGAGS